MSLSLYQKQIINNFLVEQNLPELYKEYEWKNDTWNRGFPDLICLEKKISEAVRNNTVNRSHLLLIAEWGNLTNKKQIVCPSSLNLPFYSDNSLVPWLKEEPEKVIKHVQDQIHGFGPTYSSKLLHFAVPEIFGALDTRLVRTFGRGNTTPPKYPLLKLKVTQSNNRWSIPTYQDEWPSEYKTWIEIITEIANILNREDIVCPHPQKYKQLQLRINNKWLPADVETALFSYTYQEIGGKKSKSKSKKVFSCIEQSGE